MKIDKKYTTGLEVAWSQLDFHDYISPNLSRSYNVPIKTIIDESNGYKHYNHPLCVFIPNGYDENEDYEDFYALTVEKEPVLIHYPENPVVAVSDVYYIKDFIKENVALLKEISDCGDIRKLRNTKYGELKDLNESYQPKVVMLNVLKQYTGLEHDIWLDGDSKKKHADRIKVQVQKGSFVTIDMQGIIRAGDSKRLSGKQLKRYREYIKMNHKTLMNIFSGKISQDDAIYYLKSFDAKGNVVPSNNEKIEHKTVVTVKEHRGFNTCLLHFSDETSKYNLSFANNPKEAIFKNENSEPILFDEIEHFNIDDNGIYVLAMKENELYKLYINPTIKVVKI